MTEAEVAVAWVSEPFPAGGAATVQRDQALLGDPMKSVARPPVPISRRMPLGVLAAVLSAVLAAALATPAVVLTASVERAGPKTAGTLALSPTTGVPGTSVKVAGRIPPKVRHRVRLQRLDAGAYATVRTARTDRRGRFAFRTTLPADRATASYRVLSPRTLDPRTGRRTSYVTPVRMATIVLPTPTPTSTPTPTPTQTTPTPTPTPPSGASARLTSGFDAAVAGEGGHVVYLTPSFGVGMWDLATGTTTTVDESASSLGSYWPSISADGRHVVYHSYKPDLVPGDTNQTVDLFTTDLETGSTLRIGQGESYGRISGDSRFVAYGLDQVSLWDRTTLTSVQLTHGNSTSTMAAISGDGRYVVFQSDATDLVPGDTNGRTDVFLWDRTSSTTTQVTEGNGASEFPAISADGDHVVFRSAASDLVVGDENGHSDVFVWDRATGTTTRITDGNGDSAGPTISGDGTFVAFDSVASDLVPGDDNAFGDVFVWDRSTGATTRITDGTSVSWNATTSADGSLVTYSSDATGVMDVYLWRRGAS